MTDAEISQQQLIEALKQSEALARLYAVSSSVNEAIVRVREPQRLYEMACRIAVEQGRFSLAWIAMRSALDQPLELKSSCGGTDAFIADVMRRLNSAVKSPGPAGRALRDGVAAVSNNIATDDTFFFKDVALALGMRSCAVFPMQINRQTLGILSIYSAHENYFNHEEMRVLSALADDISFAIESAEREAERKRAIDELQESQRVYATLLGNLPGMVYRCRNDQDWSLYFISDGCKGLTGYSPQELYTGGIATYEELIFAEDRQLVRDAVDDALLKRQPFEMFYRIRTKQNVERWVWERGSGVFDEHDELRFLEGYVTDITQRKLLEAQMLNAQRMESIGTFAAGIAHDFNNLLAAIAGNAQLALSDIDNTHPGHRPIREIAKAASRASELVHQVLTFSRQSQLSREPVNAVTIVNEALKSLPIAVSESIRIHKQISVDALYVSGDIRQLKQALVNVLTNAVQAMTAGGQLSIDVTSIQINDSSDARATVPMDLSPGRYACIAIGDEGAGMDAALQARIFEPFFTTRPQGQGIGLGLAVVYGIVRAHAGGIAVRSNPNEGSTFTIFLPAVEKGAEKPAEKPKPTGHGQHVLYVDDEEALVFLTTRVLERLGYRVTGFADAAQALEAFRANPGGFDAVVSDLSMPGMSGVDLARAIQRIRADVPIVMTSGYIRDEDLEVVRELGIRDLVLKPNTVEELGAVLHRALKS